MERCRRARGNGWRSRTRRGGCGWRRLRQNPEASAKWLRGAARCDGATSNESCVRPLRWRFVLAARFGINDTARPSSTLTVPKWHYGHYMHML